MQQMDVEMQFDLIASCAVRLNMFFQAVSQGRARGNVVNGCHV